MATRYPSEGDRYSRVEPGISRSGRGDTRQTGYSSRSTSGQRSAQRPSPGQQPARRPPSGQRPPQRSASGQRPAQRPPSGQRRRTPPRRRRPNRAPLFAALAAVLVIVLVLVIANPFGKKQGGNPKAQPTAIPASSPVEAQQQPAAQAASIAQSAEELNDKLGNSEEEVGSLSANEMAQVSDLKINTSLPSDWLNILMLGTDERTLNDSARTDAMIICSINRNTGEIKLSSIMRDLAVELDDIGKWSGTYRINAANFFGGPNLAMRTVNECFQMNIQYYVMVNFFGFQKIAQRLGGITIDITEAEKDKINKMIVKQAKMAYEMGIDESDQENVYLETYGENTHLNGRQTLAYARIRKLTGGDAMRTERHRIVLEKLLEKIKQLDAIQLASLASDMFDQVKTNLPFDELFQIGMLVCGNGINGLEALRLPIPGSYREETRNEQSMLYDCDFEANARELYNFIYEK